MLDVSDGACVCVDRDTLNIIVDVLGAICDWEVGIDDDTVSESLDLAEDVMDGACVWMVAVDDDTVSNTLDDAMEEVGDVGV